MNNTPQKTTVIFHSADFDGLFCREIARKFLPGATLIGWDHGDAKLPFPEEGTVYVLDLSPECFEGEPDLLNEKWGRLVWIDHHKSSIEKWPAEFPGYRIDGVAACRLAWQWFYLSTKSWKEGGGANPPNPNKGFYTLPQKEDFINRTVSEPLAVTLAGEYDIWDHAKSNNDDIVFQFGLDAYGSIDWDELLQDASHTADVHRILNAGRFAMSCYAKRDAEVMKTRSFMTTFAGLKFLCLNVARCNSNTFNALDKPETGHDGLLAFYWTGECWSVSLYHAAHRKDLDLSLIAVEQGKAINPKNDKPYGGGGHRGACGFRTNKLPFLAS